MHFLGKTLCVFRGAGKKDEMGTRNNSLAEGQVKEQAEERGRRIEIHMFLYKMKTYNGGIQKHKVFLRGKATKHNVVFTS